MFHCCQDSKLLLHNCQLHLSFIDALSYTTVNNNYLQLGKISTVHEIDYRLSNYLPLIKIFIFNNNYLPLIKLFTINNNCLPLTVVYTH